jgi:dephospho-CoA kinase
VHVRIDGTTGATDALLFRDYLRADPTARDTWGELKRTVVKVVPHCDLFSYGQIKQPAWRILMLAADAWASNQRWQPGPLAPWSDL